MVFMERDVFDDGAQLVGDADTAGVDGFIRHVDALRHLLAIRLFDQAEQIR